VTWLLTAAVIAAGAVAILVAMLRLAREIPRALGPRDECGRVLRPAVIRIRAAAEEVRARTPQA
jgi:hypothetical protein